MAKLINDATYIIAFSSVTDEQLKEAKKSINKFSPEMCHLKLVEDETWDNRITHLIVGKEQRTLKVLKAISNGIWILHIDWLLNCKSKIEKESNYELKKFGCRKSRKDHSKEDFKELLDDIKLAIKLPKGSKINENDFKELIVLNGGKTTAITKCDYCLGVKSKDEVKTLKVDWLLDSIQDYELKDTKDYIVASES